MGNEYCHRFKGQAIRIEIDESCNGQWLTECLDYLDKKQYCVVWDNFSDALFNLFNFGRIK